MKTNARVFLEGLFSGKPDNLSMLLWTLPEKRSYWVSDAVRRLSEQTPSETGISISEWDSVTAITGVRRCPSAEIAGIVGLWADIDLKSAAHANKALPTSIESGLACLPADVHPTFLVTTGNGVHAWWLFREPLIFQNEEDRTSAERLCRRWQNLIRLRAASLGFAFDTLPDLARLLRVPGTQNCKDPKSPRPVHIFSKTDRHYNPSDLTEYLDLAGIPDPAHRPALRPGQAEYVSDADLRIDFDVTVSPDILKGCAAAVGNFPLTWNHQREDLKDSSHSGYDMALACTGARAGLSHQEIIDLIVHHRRTHGGQPRKTLKYFQDTIRKAVNGLDERFGTAIPAVHAGDDVRLDAPASNEHTVDPVLKTCEDPRRDLCCTWCSDPPNHQVAGQYTRLPP